MPSALKILKERLLPVLTELTAGIDGDDQSGDLPEMVRPSTNPDFGDFQANCAMPLAKRLRMQPREVAARIVEGLDVSDMCEPPEIAGPGFINLRLKQSWIEAQVNGMIGDDRLGTDGTEQPRHVVVDFSSPNVAKPMHVGHLRSTVIGDALCRTLRFAGHRVTSDNHVGDWGTQFGMIIYGYRNFLDPSSWEQDKVGELARLYKLVNRISDYHSAKKSQPGLEDKLQQAEAELKKAEAEPRPDSKSDRKAYDRRLKSARRSVESARDSLRSAAEKVASVDADPDLKAAAAAHPEIAGLARLETSKLHAGDAGNLSLWNEFLPECLEALNRVYRRLGVEFDLTLGESFYNPMLSEVVSDLSEKGLAKNSEGAMCVFIDDKDAPFIVQKTDGAFTYATTDLATIQYRVEELQADEVLYVVDARQSEHFHALFETARRWKYPDVPCRHVSFGTVMGPDGRPYKTRSGDTVGLESLLDEAVVRARKIVDENDDRRTTIDGSPAAVLSDSERASVAESVGLGGIRYADLHHNRDSDYEFNWDRMLATTGDTAAYMQYAYARICGIFRELETDRDALSDGGYRFEVTDPAERALALQLLQFSDAIESVLADYRPHQLCAWLFDTANAFSTFYDRCSVKNAETTQAQQSRLVLCDLMARGLKTGLGLLGIETAEVM